MSTAPASYTEALEQTCTQTIGPEAANVDRQGAFPERGLRALSSAGLTGAVSAPEGYAHWTCSCSTNQLRRQ
jgi:hypothetical protein